MTRDKANQIVNKLIIKTTNSSLEYRIRYLSNYNPKLGNLFKTYIETVGITSRDFYRQAEDIVIVSDTKLGKALK